MDNVMEAFPSLFDLVQSRAQVLWEALSFPSKSPDGATKQRGLADDLRQAKSNICKSGHRPQ